jgi:trehalose synthase
MLEVEVAPLAPDRFEEVLDREVYTRFRRALDGAADRMRGRTLWNINSTALGGGVAEMLHALLPYAQGVGIETRWAVIEADQEFFHLTKRIHNLLHGIDEEPLDEEDARVYESGLAPNAEALTSLIHSGDVVLVHDPQPAGLVPVLKGLGATVVWRCHIGIDRPNDHARSAWRFLGPAVREAEAFVFSRQAYAWEGLDEDRVAVIPPSIDAFSPKNQPLEKETVDAILGVAGVVDNGSSAEPVFVGQDGAQATVARQVRMIQESPPPPEASWVTQVSRWDRLKDPLGVMSGFAEHVSVDGADPHLILAGPGKDSVSDDPEEEGVLSDLTEAWKALPDDARRRVHIASLPTEDAEENAAIVNALQRRSDVVVQKSLAEGFGLTVAEAMWKDRPVVAGRVGGIQDQVVHGETGLLIDDPRDLTAFGRAISDLLSDRERAASMGKAGHERVRHMFLGPRQMMDHATLLERLVP